MYTKMFLAYVCRHYVCGRTLESKKNPRPRTLGISTSTRLLMAATDGSDTRASLYTRMVTTVRIHFAHALASAQVIPDILIFAKVLTSAHVHVRL